VPLSTGLILKAPQLLGYSLTEMDLPLGRLRCAAGGVGAGGHYGLRSTIEALGSSSCPDCAIASVPIVDPAVRREPPSSHVLAVSPPAEGLCRIACSRR